jgi:hypothetical protein
MLGYDFLSRVAIRGVSLIQEERAEHTRVDKEPLERPTVAGPHDPRALASAAAISYAK